MTIIMPFNLDNLYETNSLTDTKFSKLTREETVLYLLRKLNSVWEGFTEEFYQPFKKEEASILYKLFQNTEEREHFTTHFMRPALPWYQNQTKVLNGKHRATSLMNIEP